MSDHGYRIGLFAICAADAPCLQEPELCCQLRKHGCMKQLKDKGIPEEVAHLYGEGPDKGLELLRVCFKIGQVFTIITALCLLQPEFQFAQDSGPAIERKINAPRRIDIFQEKLTVMVA